MEKRHRYQKISMSLNIEHLLVTIVNIMNTVIGLLVNVLTVIMN